MANVLVRELSGRKPGSDLGGRTVGSSGGSIWMGGRSTRRSIRATVPAAPTPLVQSAPPAATRAPNQLGYHLPYTIPLLPYTHPSPLPLLPLCPTAPYHAVSWYIPSMRTRVPSFGQTFPNKAGPCHKINYYRCAKINYYSSTHLLATHTCVVRLCVGLWSFGASPLESRGVRALRGRGAPQTTITAYDDTST